MTLTLNSDNNELLIESSYQNSNNDSVTLIVTVNCTTTYDDIEIDVTEENYTLTPDILVEDATEFVEGVYTIKIVTIQDGGDIVTESQCILIAPSLACDMLEIFTDLESDSENIVKAMSYQALLNIAACNTCSCSDWCTLYNTATDETCIENANPCGCN